MHTYYRHWRDAGSQHLSFWVISFLKATKETSTKTKQGWQIKLQDYGNIWFNSIKSIYLAKALE